MAASVAALRAAAIVIALGAALRAAPSAAADRPALLLPPALGRSDLVWIGGRVLAENHSEPRRPPGP